MADPAQILLCDTRDVPSSLRIAAYRAGRRVACDPPDDAAESGQSWTRGTSHMYEQRLVARGEEDRLPSQFHCSCP